MKKMKHLVLCAFSLVSEMDLFFVQGNQYQKLGKLIYYHTKYDYTAINGV